MNFLVTGMRSHTSSQVGTLFSEASSAFQSAEFRVQARLSRICSSMLLRCFTMSLESPSSDRISTSITWWQWHTQSNVTLLMFNTICYLTVIYFRLLLKTSTQSAPASTSHLHLPQLSSFHPLSQSNLGAGRGQQICHECRTIHSRVFRASLTTASCAQVKALGTCSTDLGHVIRSSCSAGDVTAPAFQLLQTSSP